MFKCTISQALFQLCPRLLISCYNKVMRFWLPLFLLASPWACYAQMHDHVQIAQRNMPAVVAVNVLSADGSTSTGTGFVITSNGFLITNYHVIEKSLYTNITFNNGVISGEALPIANSKQTDLSLLKIEAQHLPTVTLAKDDNAFPGQTITVIGNPRRLQNTVTSGIISQLRQQKNGTLWHQISAPISPSSSGSPVFNSQGEVISVAFSSITGSGNQNLNFAIPVRYVRELVEQNGVVLPTQSSSASSNAFVRHIRSSWSILKQFWARWFSNRTVDSSLQKQVN